MPELKITEVRNERDIDINTDDIQTYLTGAPVTRSYYYDPYGGHWNEDNGYDTNPFRYAGEQWDRETGSIYLRARFYSPGTGRFMTVDPIKDGVNWYAYCAGNPVAFRDPSGLEYGALRTFVEELDYLYGPSKNIYTFTEDNAVEVNVGSDQFSKSGKFYFNGDAVIPIHSGEKYQKQHIANNCDGSLFMERSDFYRAMGISYKTYVSEFTITEGESMFEAFILSLGTGAVAAKSDLGLLSSTILGSLASVMATKAGNYRTTVLVGEVYASITGEYFQIYTIESIEYDGDGDGVFVDASGMPGLVNFPISTIQNEGSPESILRSPVIR